MRHRLAWVITLVVVLCVVVVEATGIEVGVEEEGSSIIVTAIETVTVTVSHFTKIEIILSVVLDREIASN